jgi:hypothetical protein
LTRTEVIEISFSDVSRSEDKFAFFRSVGRNIRRQELSGKKIAVQYLFTQDKIGNRTGIGLCHLLALTADLRDTAHRGRSEPVNFRDLLP